MGILDKIFGTGGKTIIDSVGSVIDELSTTKEEKLEAKRKFKEMMNAHDAKIHEEVSKRWQADMQSDSWLSKNVRPLTLMFLVTSTVLMVFIDAGEISFVVDTEWKDLLKVVLITCIGAYFGGRSYEKGKK
tara:strand:- start:574 stop:966 length:393 start_codon:yes stop_codon:yes gene_type:complete